MTESKWTARNLLNTDEGRAKLRELVIASRYVSFGGEVGKVLAQAEAVLGECQVIERNRVPKKDWGKYPVYPPKPPKQDKSMEGKRSKKGRARKTEEGRVSEGEVRADI